MTWVWKQVDNGGEGVIGGYLADRGRIGESKSGDLTPHSKAFGGWGATLLGLICGSKRAVQRSAVPLLDRRGGAEVNSWVTSWEALVKVDPARG